MNTAMGDLLPKPNLMKALNPRVFHCCETCYVLGNVSSEHETGKITAAMANVMSHVLVDIYVYTACAIVKEAKSENQRHTVFLELFLHCQAT